MRIHPFLAAASIAFCVRVAPAQFLLVCDQTGRQVTLVSRASGAVVQPDFIPTSSAGLYALLHPLEAVQVHDQIWVSDDIADQIVRFDAFGQWLGTIATEIDRPRGLAVAGERVFAINSGSANGAPGLAMIEFDLAGNRVGSFALPQAWDVIERGGELLVSNSLGDDIERYSFDGTHLGTFHASDGVNGIDFPTQLVLALDGRVLAAGQSPPAGLYEYAASGAQIAWHALGSNIKGVAELDDGRWIYTTPAGVRAFDPASQSSTELIPSIAAGYVNSFRAPGPPTPYCTAGTSGLGCVASMSWSGAPSASASSSFTLQALGLEPGRTGLLFYGLSGRATLPWAQASSSVLCVRPPVQRTPPHGSGGSAGACNGSLHVDWNAFVQTNPAALGAPFFSGRIVHAQAWFRDPPAPKTTSLSNALEFGVGP